MLGKLICWWKGRARSKRISPKEQEGFAEFQCPRCKAKWTRTTKKAA
jgi:hypothetical protein